MLVVVVLLAVLALITKKYNYHTKFYWLTIMAVCAFLHSQPTQKKKYTLNASNCTGILRKNGILHCDLYIKMYFLCWKACYGILKVPEGSWLCRTCVLGVHPQCILCPKRGGAMKPTRTGTKWAHVSCALWIPEVLLILYCLGLSLPAVLPYCLCDFVFCSQMRAMLTCILLL